MATVRHAENYAIARRDSSSIHDQPQHPADDDEIDLADLLISLWQQRVLLLSVFCLALMAAACYAFLATPHYQVQSILRPVSHGALDELNGTGVYELDPSEALNRVSAGLSSYEKRLEFFRENQDLFAALATSGRSLEQVFEDFNASAFKMLQADPKSSNTSNEFTGISLTYPEGVDGVAVVNGLVAHVLESERERIVADIQALIENRLQGLQRKIEAARENYAASKQAQIAALLEQSALRRAQLQDELHALRIELKRLREARIKLLEEAESIAKALGIKNPTTPSAMTDERWQGQLVSTEISNQEIPLYFLGTEALRAEQEVLRGRHSDDFSEPRIAEIQKEMALLGQNRQVDILRQRQNEDLHLQGLAKWREEETRLKGIEFDASNLQLANVDQVAIEPFAAAKPKKALIIAMGGIFGLMLGIVAFSIKALASRFGGRRDSQVVL